MQHQLTLVENKIGRDVLLRSEYSKSRARHRKRFSHQRSYFPSQGGTAHRRADQRLGEFDPQQMVAIGMGYANDFRAEVARALGDRSRRSQGSAGNLE